MSEIGAVEHIPKDETRSKQIITVKGRNTDALLNDPEKGNIYEGLLQRPYEFRVHHPKRKTGILVLPAFGGHTEGVPLDYEQIADKYNATIVTTQHPTWTFSSEFAVAQFEDLMEEQEFEEVVFIGPSLGGTLGLELLRDFKSKGDLPFEPKALVTIGSPTCKADLQPDVRLKLNAAIALRRAIIQGRKILRDPKEITGEDATGAKKSDAEFHGQIARASVLLQQPRVPGDYPNIPVFALILPPGKDQLVKDESRERLKGLFPQVTFETFDAQTHSQEEYVKRADEIEKKVERFLDSQLIENSN